VARKKKDRGTTKRTANDSRGTLGHMENTNNNIPDPDDEPNVELEAEYLKEDEYMRLVEMQEARQEAKNNAYQPGYRPTRSMKVNHRRGNN